MECCVQLNYFLDRNEKRQGKLSKYKNIDSGRLAKAHENSIEESKFCTTPHNQ